MNGTIANRIPTGFRNSTPQSESPAERVHFGHGPGYDFTELFYRGGAEARREEKPRKAGERESQATPDPDARRNPGLRKKVDGVFAYEIMAYVESTTHYIYDGMRVIRERNGTIADAKMFGFLGEITVEDPVDSEQDKIANQDGIDCGGWSCFPDPKGCIECCEDKGYSNEWDTPS